VALEALVRLLVPNLTRGACGEVGLFHTAGFVFLLHRAAGSAAGSPASSAGAAAIVAPGRPGGWRGESQSDGENSTEDERGEANMAFLSG
jgi:hypothetical protein